MAKFDIKFLDNQEEHAYIQTFIHPQIPVIVIKGESNGIDFSIWLDKSTAIKFAKTLRTEINKITAREEGKDGQY